MHDFNQMAIDEAKRSPCQKRKVGAVVVSKTGLQYSTGHNYNPTGEACETSLGVTAKEVVHAEISAIEKADFKCHTIYVTHQPCAACRKAIEQAGIEKICIADDFMKFDSDKLRYDLIPPSTTLALAKVLTHGAKKYKPNNWRKGSIERYVAATFRHFEAYRSGETIDNDSGLPHLEHLLTNVAFLIELDKSESNK